MALILLIEDNLEIRENITEILELTGHEIVVAENGTDGIAAAKEKMPELILCDVLMPETNGYEVFNALKATDSTANIPFIFVTANAEKSEMQIGLKMGAHAYIRKPFEMEELLEAIDKCLGH